MTASERQKILKELHSDEHGLGADRIEKLRTEHGWNELPERKSSLLKLFLSQFQDTMVYILLGAVVVSLLAPLLHEGEIDSRELLNGVVILLIVIINAVFGFIQESRAENAIASLKKLSSPRVKVRRSGVTMMIDARELVPGDLMLIEAGDRVSADARIIASSSLEIDESTLTGESVPVAKRVEEMVPIGSGFSPGMLYTGTLATRGSGEAVVRAIALNTEIGKITSLVMELESPPTPLQVELTRTGQRIGILVLALCVLIFIVGLLKGMEPIELFFTAVSLAVAAVPEGLPAIVTVCLALGVQRMIKKHALIRRLDAVETLGNITVICADKTGTMTENRMRVTELWVSEGADEKDLVRAAASCNRAELPDIGDPTEIALLKHAEDKGVERLPILEEEVPFTSEAKYMVTAHSAVEAVVKYFKGAPEVIARFVPERVRADFLKRSEEYSREGLRVLGVAKDSGSGTEALGLVAMMDPPRTGVHAAIERAKKAGIRTIMITGDHPATALTIAREVGIETDGVADGNALEAMDEDQLTHALKTVSVFARVQPIHKVRILESLQRAGEIVSMSGDGVNDAPALKRAHVGVAMGLRGTDVAREASAMVLTDDDYSTIVSAIAEGRRIYDNIKKFVIFLMRCNLGEVMTIAGAMALLLPLPLLPLHILWMNLVTDSFPALALAAETGEKGIMNRPPRKKGEGIFTGEWTLLFISGCITMALCLLIFAFTIRSGGGIDLARTMALTTSIVFQLFLAFSTRTKSPAFFESPFKNRWLLLAVCGSIGAHLLLLYTPMNILFAVIPLTILDWAKILILASIGFIVIECVKWARIR